MKKIIAFLLTCVMSVSLFVAPTFAADTVALTLSEVTVDVGADSTISVPVKLTGTAEAGQYLLGSLQFVLDLPAGVTFTGAAKAATNTYAWTNQTTTNNNQFYFDDASGAGADIIANPEYAEFVLNFTVDTSVAGTYEIGVDASTISCLDFMDYKDYSEYGASASLTEGKIIVKAKEVANTYADVSYTEDATEAVNGYKNAGVLATFTVDAQANYAVSALWLKGNAGTAKVTFPEITSGTGKVAINVTNVPADVTLTAKGLAITSYDPASN